MSSNSSADGRGRRLLQDAFAVLGDEAPAHSAQLCQALAGFRVNIVLGDEAFAAGASDRHLKIDEPTECADVTLHTSLATVLGLLDARLTLGQAIACGELDLRGNAQALDTSADAFSIFLHGLVRAPSSPGLLDKLRHCVVTSNRR